MHFEKLNYSFANETTDIELSLLPEGADSVFCIAGSGSRVIPLLTKNPISMDVYDSSITQLYLAELRYEALKQLSYNDFLRLLGYRSATASERINIFTALKLRSEVNHFWSNLNTEWHLKGFIYIGSWEKKLQILRKIFYFFHLKNLGEIFANQDSAAFPKIAWNFFCLSILTEPVVRRLLYSGQSRYNLKVPFGKFIQTRFMQQIEKNQLQDEFFLQFLFSDQSLPSTAWPLEANEAIFIAAKASNAKVRFVHKNISDIECFNYSFYSLSDCFSYLSEDISQKIIHQITSSSTKSSGLLRYFMFVPSLDLSQMSEVTKLDPSLDRVPIYQMTYFKT